MRRTFWSFVVVCSSLLAACSSEKSTRLDAGGGDAQVVTRDAGTPTDAGFTPHDAFVAPGTDAGESRIDAGESTFAADTFLYVPSVLGIPQLETFAVDTRSGHARRIDNDPSTPTTDDEFLLSGTPQNATAHLASRFLYAANYGAEASITMATWDATSGVVHRVGDLPVAEGVYFVAAGPDASHVLAVTPGNHLQLYTIDSATGALTFSSAVATGRAPRAIAMRPGLVLVTHDGDGSVGAFTYDAVAHTLARVDQDPGMSGDQDLLVGPNPIGIVLHPTAPYAFVAVSGSGAMGDSVAVVRFDAAGALTLSSSLMLDTSSSPLELTLDATGTYLYVAASGSPAGIVRCRVDAETGRLSRLGATTAPEARMVRADPSAPVVWARITSGQMQGFRIDAASGDLTPILTEPLSIDYGSFDFVVAPVGR